MKKFRVYGLTCVLMIVAAAASATTIVMPTDEQLIAKSPVIVTGTVLSIDAVERDGAVWTEASVAVAAVMKGEAPRTIVVRELGGEANGRFTRVFGTAEFETGQRVLLFLEKSPSGGYRTMDLFVGKLTEGRQLDGRRLWLRDDLGADVAMLDANFEPIRAKNVQRDAGAFETFVVDRVAGRAGNRNYGVENPVLARPNTNGGARENFTLLSEPDVYRWARFDTGASAAWFSGGTQPGYSGGGVTEMTTAMASWTGYSQAKIFYTYAGVRSSNFGGLSRQNGVNEVLFNDPLNEISGTFTGSGVVGTGGFNGVSGMATWTAPFTADASHTAGAHTAYTISEGNLTIQDGVTASNISSSRLAEIIAHEFGHTLGFGHSDSSNALMYAFVTGLGPSLRADDQTAARWLYPNGAQSGGGGGGGGGTTTIPAAPSNLQTAVAGSSVVLSWSDNATNETSQSVYYAAATGAFTKVSDVNANVTSTTLSGFTAGTYRFYVNATNSAGTSANSNTATATVSTQLTARFSFTPQSGSAGATNFTFTDESLGNVTSRSWNFGDGAGATTATATHVYARSGTYTVTLTVSGGGASSQASNVVTVANTLAAAFSWSPSNPTTNDDVTFLDQSAGGVSSWYWTLGDGSISQQQNPTKRYGTPGTYSVTLSITRGTESAVLTKNVIVAAAAPTIPAVAAAFDASTTSPTVGQNVTFTDRSTGSPISWIWSFGDGTTSTAQNPVHSYDAPGTYNVSLFTSNAANSGTAFKSLTVAALPPYRSLISAAAQQGGIGGTSWRTELSLFNAGAQGASVTALFIPAAGGSMVTRSLFLAPKQSATYANTLLDLFGIANGAGAVAIEATSAGTGAQLRITSRTFTNGSIGTYGQSVPDVRSPDLGATLYLTGIQSNAAYRTNIGLVNRGGSEVGATLTLYDGGGNTVSTANVTIPANNFQQASLSSFFPETAGRSYNALSLRMTTSSSDVVTAYASMIDNASQDPVYIQAMPAKSGSSMTLPVVARANGANGTFWRSDVTFFNPSNTRVFLSVRYSDTTKSLSLGARETYLLADVLTQFGYSSGNNPLTITWSGGAAPVVTSRTYTTDERGGTFGQSIDPVDAFTNEQFVPGLRSDFSYRSNVGVLNGGSDAEELTVTLLSPAGFELASTRIVLQPGELMQQAVTSLFPGVSASTGSFTLYVRGDANARVFAYGSMIDNASGDPVFFAGK
ncbi:MAG TPA: PKD domain-containing protein [Vicinamibacterales bacterium]